MKYLNIVIINSLLLGMICFPSISNAQGIVFGHNLNEALAKAKVENKLVFIDFYTSWCGPCRVLSNDVFPLKKVGTFFNTNFICIKIQCDDNGFGVEMGKKYQVGAYPTLMFLNKYGEFIHSAAGALSPEELINLGKVALDPRENLYSIIKKWETGKRDSESALIYFKTLKEAYRSEKASEDFNLYFNNLSFEEKTKLVGQSDSIIFEHQNFDRILAKSKETGKLIFMDAYTTWCGPCKYMANNVFKVDKVAIYFNKNLINTKVDMEKGEGITLRERYKIVAYPTFLLIDAEGNEIHRIVGSFDPDVFIAKIEEGLGNKSVSRMDLIYKQNQYDNDFIISYIKKLTEVYKNEEASEVADKYLNKMSFSEKADPKNWFIFENHRLTNYGSDRYQFIIKNRKALYESIGKERVEKLISRLLLSPLLPYLQGLTEYDAKRIDQIEKEVKDIKPINSKDILLLIKLTRARGEKKFEKFINLVDSNGDKISSSTLVIVVRVMGFIAEEGGSKEQCTKASEVLSKFYEKSEGDSNKEYHLRVVNYLKRGPYTYKKKTEKV